MATKIPVPKLGQSEETVTIASWRVKEGDKIKKGDVLFEVETDKAVLEVESQFEGTILKIVTPVGVEVPVMTTTAAIVGEPGEQIPADMLAAAPAAAPAASAPAPVPAPAPQAAPAPAAQKAAAPAPAQDKPEGVATLIDIAQFKQVSLRVGHILTAEKVEKADKLLKFSVQVGDEVRTIVSGIAKYYTPEEMVGKQVVVVANLKPAKLRGIESQGMLLCAVTTDGNVVLVSPEKSVPSGSEVC